MLSSIKFGRNGSGLQLRMVAGTDQTGALATF